MSAWRHQAFERFPEFRTKLQESKAANMYWIELQFAFSEAYRKGNTDLFKRILDYADWCFTQPRGKAAGDDLATCVFTCFFEHMPQISNEELIDQDELGLSLLQWNGTTITHPHVRALYQKLMDSKKAKAKRSSKK